MRAKGNCNTKRLAVAVGRVPPGRLRGMWQHPRHRPPAGPGSVRRIPRRRWPLTPSGHLRQNVERRWVITDPEGGQAGRYTGRAADGGRRGHQRQDGASAGPDHSRVGPAAGHRGDSVDAAAYRSTRSHPGPAAARSGCAQGLLKRPGAGTPGSAGVSPARPQSGRLESIPEQFLVRWGGRAGGPGRARRPRSQAGSVGGRQRRSVRLLDRVVDLGTGSAMLEG
jgi:hypothetical protein